MEGMTCTGCERAISDAVQKLEGVLEVKADYQTGRVEVSFDTTLVGVPSISKAIEEKGYSVKAYQRQSKP
ncbi:MAG: cation transporter [Bacteroidales bacterium]